VTGAPAPVRAAGGVVWRPLDGGLEVLLVHRPRYDDWSFPKGKLEPGESHEAGALREVEEEVRMRCVLGHELLTVSYVDSRGRPKVVRYWEMTVAEDLGFEPNSEVDEVAWLDVEDARQRLSYRHDARVLDDFVRFAGLAERTSGEQ
jgi:8-oxo-dGTP pyrophosphatase MutT (NUDIX family)